MRRSSVTRAVVIALLMVGTRASAQTPALGEVPAGIAEPLRTQLTRQRADLAAQRDSIAAKVRAHNDRCSEVPEGSALEATCATAHKELSALITTYRTAVERFNDALRSATRGKP
jgi:hypothetical protein